MRRVVSRAVLVVLTAALLPALPVAAAAAASPGPSVPLPGTNSAAVAAEPGQSRGPDEASRRALSGDQSPIANTPDAGTPAATSLSPSATWEVAAHSGDFSWSYPLRVPPAPGGLEPDLALSYRSSSVDGRSSVTNNQSSWIGEGWDLWPGFIERSYGSCLDDGHQTGDLCWRNDNATASFPGSGGTLIRGEGDTRWHLKSDDGAKVERIRDPGHRNGDNDGEHWKITTTDGTQYWFGSQPDSRSTWTVPVFGDDRDEPCNRGTYDTSHCVQAWRWNLDKVVDRNGNAIRYFYEPETNRYGLNIKKAGVDYIRGGTLQRIDYGLHEGLSTPATGRVEFTLADRCVPGLPAASCGQDKTGNWPDTPLNLGCGTPECDDHVPSFWTTKRLTAITTMVRRGTDYTPVDRWTLGQLYPEPGDPSGQRKENAALWLKEIRHTGLVHGSIELPPVTFEGTQLANRVDGPGDGRSAIWRYRVTGVISESGGVTSVNYAPTECTPANVPAKHEDNRMRCYPVKWKKPSGAVETQWFHKYVVSSVIQSDLVSSSTQTETRYEYLDGAAWRWDNSEFAKEETRTWNEFRGYGRVRTRTGATDDPGGSPVAMIEQRYHRGMHGDRGRQEIRVSDSLGESGTSSRVDWDWLQGMEFETTTYADGQSADPAVLERTVSHPVWHGPTASRDPHQSYIVRNGTERRFTALASGGFRQTKTVTSYDHPVAPGLFPTRVDDLGDVATGADDRCTTTAYSPNTTTWHLDLPVGERVVSVGCGSTPRFPEHALSEGRFGYDDRGNKTSVEVARERPASGPVWTSAGTAKYDRHGRVTESTDPMGRRSTNGHTPAEGGPVTAVTATSPATQTLPQGLVTTTTLEPATGTAVKEVDPNGRVTELAYDALGRRTQVWLANRPRSDNPRGSTEYAYQIRREAPSVVTTSQVGPNGAHTTSTALFDGSLRPRQTQRAAAGGGRLLVDTRYDSHGRAYKTTQPYFNADPVDGVLRVAADTEIPGLTRTRFDGLGRPVSAVYQQGAHDAWSSTTGYGGDRTHSTPPNGGTATTVLTDAHGRTTERRQYHAPTPTGSFEATRYAYAPSGQLAEVTGPDGAVWRFGYDLRGRRTSSTDPDAGLTTMEYDDAGRLTSTRNQLGRSTFRGYDELGRKTELRESGPTGPVLARWTYDTAGAGKGLPATATRLLGADSYTSRIGGYTALNKVLNTSVTLPASAGLLAGTYTWGFGYGADGTVTGETYPGVPNADNLGAQTVNHDHDHSGRPTVTRTGGGVKLVSGTLYTRYGEVERLEQGAEPRRAWQSFYYHTSTRRLMRSIVDTETAAPMRSDVHYTYDKAGTITSMADRTLERPADIQCLRHDHLRRLTEAWTTAAAQWREPDGTTDGGCTAEPGDSAGADGPAPYRHSYRHGPGGNRVEETHHVAGAKRTREYRYPTGSQPHTLRTVAGPAGTESYDYDAIGQLTRRVTPGSDQTLEWDAEGRLAKVTGTGGETGYVYDADGTRLLRKDSGGTTLYLGKQEVFLPAAGGKPTVTRYYSHGGRIVAMAKGATMTWLAGDHQGTGQVAVNTETLAVSQRRQLPYGGPRGEQQGAWPGERGFVGGTMDASTGLTNLRAREYDPGTGRFISPDPVMDVADPQQMHGYSYANNNPVTFSDPSGLACSGPDGIGCGHKVSKEGYGDQRDDGNRTRYKAAQNRWVNNYRAERARIQEKLRQPVRRNGDGIRCADGAKTCKTSVDADAARERHRRDLERSQVIREQMNATFPKEAKAFILELDGVNWASFESGSVCIEAGGGVLVHASVTGCINWDSVGFTVSGNVKGGLKFGGGASITVVVRANDQAADKVDAGLNFSGEVGPKVIAGVGGGVKAAAEHSLLDGGRSASLEFEFGTGADVSLGGGYVQLGLNPGYRKKWDEF
ncbi:RHS repeat-associated core domain-containing protein [Crossiella cryophila]|uniref:RHS repeat-associated protein n=1 Tax=Crossiella cryophila TaxID=43355 RepID=A0A7W7CCK0_9PSEU|nr:RHS repeat-associated core domain-containing protein [Crossiella cryophila]MBB4678685.1 RHS repeat-associated protein [Crossiella cryophila]